MDIDKLLPYVLVLFVLSQVSERIANLLKLYLPSTWFGNLDVKERNPIREKIRERKIFALSILAGAITTAIFYLSYAIGEDDKSKFDPWVQVFINYWFASFILFSLFLSFGSKFWHDLLDIIYLYKNAQRVIKSGEALQADSADQVSAMLTISSVKIAQKALAEKKSQWMAIKGVIAVGIGATANEEPTLRIYYEEGSKAAALPYEFPYTDDHGVIRMIRLEKILSSPVVPQSVKVGAAVAHQSKLKVYGTMGFLFQDKFKQNRYYASSCYHVLRPENQDWDFYKTPQKPDIICQNLKGVDCDTQTILYKGGRTEDYDAALTRLNTIQDLPPNSLPRIAKSANLDQYYANLRVNILTCRGLQVGYIHEWRTTVEMRYGPNDTITFLDFFSVRSSPNADDYTALKSVTQEGDSGSAVYANGEALGMVVGGSNLLTYCVKITTLENQMGIKVLPHPSLSPSTNPAG